jgi:tetratricopeptide (TPR) repeat protein
MPVSKKPRKPKTGAGTVSPKSGTPELPALPDRRAMEGMLSRFTAGFGSGPADDALADAQDLMYTAWETPDRRRRISLAKQALRLSPLCADAYVLLAEETAGTPTEAIELYRKGLEAGEQALGPAVFRDDVGHFWGLLETRPYMRARSGLAQALWAAGHRDEAIGHYRELLRLNPNDNQGNRYLLAACLLDLDRDGELVALLDTYGREHSAEWSYTTALMGFRRGGDTPEAQADLQEALEVNAHVPAYLLGRKKLPRAQASYITMGGDDEAREYVRRYGAAWARTVGATEWLAKHLPDDTKTPRHR